MRRVFFALPFLLVPLLWIPLRASLDMGAAKEALVLVTDPAVLDDLEERGYSLGDWFGTTQLAGTSNAKLASDTAFRDVVATVAKDLQDFQARDPRLGQGMNFGHRLFDLGWLTSKDARFELIGVSNRFDRQPFNTTGCGEVRFVYRLAYRTQVKGQTIASRLPMTVNVVTTAMDADGKANCPALAMRWIQPKNPGADSLLDAKGPLARNLFLPQRIKSVEINLQSVRWPSTIRGDMAGHAEYLLRVFHFDAGQRRLLPAPLENTPDVARLKKDPALRAELNAWLRDHLADVDGGTAVLPTKFLATRAVSIAPRGLARVANRPFSRIFTEQDFKDLALSGKTHIASPTAFMRRLDDLSCTGCHQARSVAGFHLLGRDPKSTVAANALAVAMSAHLAGDLTRRQSRLLQVAGGLPPDETRPLSEQSLGDRGFGAHCGLGDPGFAQWQCADGLSCQANSDDENDPVGRCLPPKPAVGSPCEPGRVTKNADAHRDSVRNRAADCGPGAVCETNLVGFPGGMCAASCDSLSPDAACGGIARLVPFNACLAQNRPFEECLSLHVTPAALRQCDERNSCRDDYVCASSPSGAGVCIPPYFMFQMRVDGHSRAKR